MKDKADKSQLDLCINEQPIGIWFKEQFDKLKQTIHRPIQPKEEAFKDK